MFYSPFCIPVNIFHLYFWTSFSQWICYIALFSKSPKHNSSFARNIIYIAPILKTIPQNENNELHLHDFSFTQEIFNCISIIFHWVIIHSSIINFLYLLYENSSPVILLCVIMKTDFDTATLYSIFLCFPRLSKWCLQTFVMVVYNFIISHIQWACWNYNNP